MAKTKYLPVFDYIRMLALFLVVLVHTQPFIVEQTFDIHNWVLYLIFFLGKLGVPLFVMISGALLLGKVESNKTFFSKRLKRIILPWIFWSIALFVCGLQLPSSFSLVNLFKRGLIIFLSDYWFMPMLVGLYVLTPLFRKIVSSTANFSYIFLVWFGVVSILPALFLGELFPGSSSAGLLNLTISFAGYYLLGFWLWQQKNQLFNSTWLVVSVIASATCYLLIAQLTKTDPNRLFFSLQDYFSPAIVIGSVSMFLLFIKNHQAKQLGPSKNILQRLGRMTYGVFLSHILIIRLLVATWQSTNSQTGWQFSIGINWIIRAGLIYILSYLLIFGLQKIPKLQSLIT